MWAVHSGISFITIRPLTKRPLPSCFPTDPLSADSYIFLTMATKQDLDWSFGYAPLPPCPLNLTLILWVVSVWAGW